MRFSMKHFALVIALLFSGLPVDSQGADTVTSKGKTVEAAPTYEGTVTSYTRRGNEKFSVGYYVKDGKIVDKYSLLADKDAPVSRLDLDIAAKGEAFNSVIAIGKGTDLTLTGSISASDTGDGRKASDFSGLGAQIVAFDYAKVKVDSMKIDTKGFVRAAFITDTHAQILVKDSAVTTLGANPLTQAFKGYVNSANQNIMLSPPWVLGIQGGIRAGNMLGEKATLTVINSKITSGGWAILSTDACTSPMMNVVDSQLEILPSSKGGMSSGKFPYSSKYGSGYGTYLIGNSKQNFYGVTFSGLTYASIFTGGEGFYRSSSGKIELMDADGGVIETIAGKGKPTTINAVFGFMTHGDATVNVLDGTVVNSENAIFLNKAGGASFIADNAVLNSGSGVILQMIDNDDRTVGGSMEAFNTEFKEAPGWPSENGNVTAPGAAGAGGSRQGGPGGMPGGREGAPGGREGGPGGPGGRGEGGPGGMGGSSDVKLTLTNGVYKGNVFNGSGYYNQSGNPLEVAIGNGATLTGAVSLTETRHINETGKQNTRFTINEYYYLGHVENRNYRNKTATLSLTLKDGGVWKVTGESLLSKFMVDKGTVEGADGAKVVMKIDGKEQPIRQGETYSGNIVVSLAK